MTEKIYDFDSYIREFTAVVEDSYVSDGRHIAVLDRTAFFPEGGGQPSDIGMIEDSEVSFVFVKDGKICHVCTRLFDKGQPVKCSIDFKRRFLHMQIHTGEHILSGLIQSKFGIKNVGFHIGSDFNTIDLDRELSDSMLSDVEYDANCAVWKNERVKAYFPDPEEFNSLKLRKRPETSEPVKVIRAGSSDICACCGTHVANTGEIGIIKIIRADKYKGGTRIEFLCGGQALADYGEKNELLRQASVFFSVKPDKVMDGISHLKSELIAEKEKNEALGKKLLSFRSKELFEQAHECGGVRLVISMESGFTPVELKNLSLELSKHDNTLCCLFCADKSGNYAYAVSADEKCGFDARVLSKELNRAFGGRGGGNPGLCQGVVSSVGAVNLTEFLTVFCMGL